MKAQIENGGVFTSTLQQVCDCLILFNEILNVIGESEDTEELKEKMQTLFFRARKFLIKNPFTYGFTHEGFEVYQEGLDRKIFVECETDVEL